MRPTGLARSLAVLAAGCAGAAIIYWPIPYAEISLLERTFLLRWLMAAVIAGFAGRWFARYPAARTALLVAAGFAVAVIGRVIVEVMADPTDHNLWPFEVVIALVVGVIGAFAGALLAPRGRASAP
jgi:hypothetical protein